MKKLLLLIFVPVVLLAQNPQAVRFPKGLKADSVFSLNGLSILFRVEPERNVLGLWDDSTVVYTGNTRTAWFNSSGLNVLTALYVNGNIVKSMAHADSGRYSTHISNSKSMSYSDSTWWWNKRDTASVPGVPTINRMLDSLADIRTSISAAGVTSVTGSLGVIALPTTGATKIRLDKLNIDTVGTITSGSINWTGAIVAGGITGSTVTSTGTLLIGANFALAAYNGEERGALQIRSISGATNWYLPDSSGTLMIKEYLKSIAFSDSTWWWNKRDTASVPGVPTINRMLDSLADIRTSISAAGVTSWTAGNGLLQNATTGAITARVNKSALDSLATSAVHSGDMHIQTTLATALTLEQTSTDDVQLGIIRTGGTTSSWYIYIPGGQTDLRFYNVGDRMKLSTTGVLSGVTYQGTAITDTYLATISTAGKVSGAAITSGTIAGTTIFGGASVNVSGTIAGYGLISGGGGGAGNLSLYNAAGYKNIIVAGATPTSADQTFTFPALTGTIITTSNLSSITTVGTVATGVWQGTSITTAYTDAKITSITGSLGITALPATGATKIRLDKTAIDSVGTLIVGSISWVGNITTAGNVRAMGYLQAGNPSDENGALQFYNAENSNIKTLNVGNAAGSGFSVSMPDAAGTLALTTDKPATAVYSDSTARADWAKVTNKPAHWTSTGALPTASTTNGYYAAQTIRFKQSAGQETNAGSISYNEISAGYLDIIGMGSTNANRLIYMFDCVGVGAAPSTSYNMNLGTLNVVTGIYANGTVGISGTRTVMDGTSTPQTVTITNGIITGWTQ